jgi:hypothetical protein
MPQPFLLWSHTRKLTDFEIEHLFYLDTQNQFPLGKTFKIEILK